MRSMRLERRLSLVEPDVLRRLALQLQFLILIVDDLEEEHPAKLRDALGVAIDADILAHDVLDGFDYIANGHGIEPESRDPLPEGMLKTAYLRESGHLAVERERGEFGAAVLVGN